MLLLLVACMTGSGKPEESGTTVGDDSDPSGTDDSATDGVDDSGTGVDDSGTGPAPCVASDLELTTAPAEGWFLVFNEVYAAPGNKGSGDEDEDLGTDWIELYNRSSDPISLKGLTLADTDHTDDLARFDSIAGFGRLLLYADGDATTNGVDFRLSDGGETLTLATADGTVKDSLDYPEVAQACSVSRITDGDPTWGAAEPTPDEPN
jgi:hypothetical protein